MALNRNVNLRPVAGRALLQFRAEPDTVGGLAVRRKVSRGVYREAVVRALPAGYAGELRVGDTVLCPPWPDREFVLAGDRVALVPADKIPCTLE